MGNLISNYQKVETSNYLFHRSRLLTNCNIWAYDKEEDCWYLQWKGQQLRQYRNTAAWYPYVTSNEVKPIYLKRLPVSEGWGKNDWAITFKK